MMEQLLLGSLLLLLLLTLISTISTQASEDTREQLFSLNNRSLAASASSKWDEGLKDVQLVRKEFEATLKSCLGSYCGTALFTNLKLERIGLLSPDFGHILFLQNIAKEWGSEESQILVPAQNAPAYGGRNHGWTKIVRFADNLVLQAFKITQAKFQESNLDTSSNEPLFKQSFDIHVSSLFIL